MQSVLFDVLPKPGHVEEYFSMAAQLKPIVEQNPGFISVERFANLQNHDCIYRFHVGKMKSHWLNGVVSQTIMALRFADEIRYLMTIVCGFQQRNRMMIF